MANGEQQGGTIFSRALQVSTPGFDSLLNTIEEETQRIRRNQQLARQREQQFKLFKAKQEIQQKNQAEMLRAKDEVQRSQLQFQQNLEEDMLEHRTEEQVEQWQRTTGKANQLEAQQQALQDWNDAQIEAEEIQENLITGDYSSVFGNVLPYPNIQAHRTETGIQYFNQRENGQLETLSQFRQRADMYKGLGDFYETIKNPNNLASAPGQNQFDGRNIVTIENQDEWLKKIRSGTMSEKTRYLSDVLSGDLLAYTPNTKNQLGIGEVEKEEEFKDLGFDSSENAFRANYTNLYRNFNNKDIPLDPTILQDAGVAAPSVDPQTGSPTMRLDKTPYGQLTEIRKAYRNFLLDEIDASTTDPQFALDNNGNVTLQVREEELREKTKHAWNNYKAVDNAKTTLDIFAQTDFEFPAKGDPENWVLNFDDFQNVKNEKDFSRAVRSLGNPNQSNSEDTKSIQQIIPAPPGSNVRTRIDTLSN